MTFTVDTDVLANALLYVTNRVQDPDRRRTAKVLYLADKCHLERYGLPITGDSYIKTRYGPTPAATDNAIRALGGEHYRSSDVVGELIECLKNALHVKDSILRARREANLDELSESMVECLDDVIREYDQLCSDETTDISHDAAWNATMLGQTISVESIVATLDDSELLLDYLRDPHGLAASERESVDKAV